jgi:hypothetical protein
MIDYASGGLGAVTMANDGLPWFDKGDYLGERLRGRELPHRQIPRSWKSGRVVLRDFLEYERNTRFVSEYPRSVHVGVRGRSAV